MSRYQLHIRSNDGYGRGYRSGYYQDAGTTQEDAKYAAQAFIADRVEEGWQISKRRVDGSKTWLTHRNASGQLLRILVEIEEGRCPA